MVSRGKENQEKTFPAIWPVNPLWKKALFRQKQLLSSLQQAEVLKFLEASTIKC
jgi:hypothetical protein